MTSSGALRIDRHSGRNPELLAFTFDRRAPAFLFSMALYRPRQKFAEPFCPPKAMCHSRFRLVREKRMLRPVYGRTGGPPSIFVTGCPVVALTATFP